MFSAMSRRKAVQFSRAGLNAGSGGGGDGGDDGEVVKESVKKTSLKEGREEDSICFRQFISHYVVAWIQHRFNS